MNWPSFYKLLEADNLLLTDDAVVRLLEDRLRRIEAAQDRLEVEALRCDRLLDLADSLRGEPPPD